MTHRPPTGGLTTNWIWDSPVFTTVFVVIFVYCVLAAVFFVIVRPLFTARGASRRRSVENAERRTADSHRP